MPEPVSVKFHFDIVSPYSCLAFERLRRYEKAWNLSIDLCPVHLGTILRSSGNFPPFSSSVAKLKYTVMDIHRSAQELQLNWNLKLNAPPAPSLPDMTMIGALKTILPEETFKEVVGRLFAEHIAHDDPPSDIFACLVPSHISQETLNQARLISQTDEFRDSYGKEQQDLIANHGAFGLPWILLQRPGETDPESFWGGDRMSEMAHWLGPEYVYNGAFPRTA